MKKTVDVVVGAPIYRAGAYVLGAFPANQRLIQQCYPSSELVLATNGRDFADELEALIASSSIEGHVLRYETVKPPYARSRVWNTACGRDAIRRYMLGQTQARYLLSLDADMTYDPAIIELMFKEVQGCDVVVTGYLLRHTEYMVGMGQGCAMLARHVLQRIEFRCVEFRNGGRMDEGSPFELDLIRLGSRVRKGIFVGISHYINENEALSIRPQPLGLFRSITTSRLVRYAMISLSLLLRRDISRGLQALINDFLKTREAPSTFVKRDRR